MKKEKSLGKFITNENYRLGDKLVLKLDAFLNFCNFQNWNYRHNKTYQCINIRLADTCETGEKIVKNLIYCEDIQSNII